MHYITPEFLKSGHATLFPDDGIIKKCYGDVGAINPGHEMDILATCHALMEADAETQSWSRLSEQNLRVDKWSVCRVRLPSGGAAG